MKITEFPEVNELQDANVFLIDGPNGTKVIKGENLPYALMDIAGVEMHRMLFRGKILALRFLPNKKRQFKTVPSRIYGWGIIGRLMILFGESWISIDFTVLAIRHVTHIM